MFSMHTTSEKFENATISSHVGFVFQENSGSEIIVIIVLSNIVEIKMRFQISPTHSDRVMRFRLKTRIL